MRALAVVALAIVAYFVLTPTGRYLLRAGWEEGKILARRQPIAQLVADSATTPALRAKLALVLAARAFAHDSLALETGESFTTFSRLDRDTLVLLLSGAYRDELRPAPGGFPSSAACRTRATSTSTRRAPRRAPSPPTEISMISQACEDRLRVRDAVPPFDHLRARRPEAEDAAAVGHGIDAGGGHRQERGRAGVDRQDARSDLDPLGSVAGTHQAGRIEAVRLGDPDRVEASLSYSTTWSADSLNPPE